MTDELAAKLEEKKVRNILRHSRGTSTIQMRNGILMFFNGCDGVFRTEMGL